MHGQQNIKTEASVLFRSINFVSIWSVALIKDLLHFFHKYFPYYNEHICMFAENWVWIADSASLQLCPCKTISQTKDTF